MFKMYFGAIKLYTIYISNFTVAYFMDQIAYRDQNYIYNVL